MADIFREIDEELRRENFAKLWTRYGNYLIALAIAVVVAVALVVGWRGYQARQRQAEGVRYAQALDLAKQGKDAAAVEAFGGVAHDAGGGHAMLARFEEAFLRGKQGDAAGATKAYDQLAQDSTIEPAYRDLATLLSARYALDQGDPKAVAARLQPLTDAGNPWHATALELTALAQLKGGDTAAARTSYQHLADDLTAPQAVRARATEMVAALAQ